MKISKVIQELEKIKSWHGDLDVEILVTDANGEVEGDANTFFVNREKTKVYPDF